MLRSIRSRRPHRPRYGVYICAVISALLLLLSVSLLYTRLSHSESHHFHYRHQNPNAQYGDVSLTNPLISDELNDGVSIATEDKIDELDDVAEETPKDEEVEDEEDPQSDISQSKVSGYVFDHVTGVIRRGFNKRKIEDWDEDYNGFTAGLGALDKSKVAFGSDDVPVDMEVRRRMSEVVGIEDALLLKVGRKVSPLREGWGEWFDKKGDFLRRDRMFKSNLEMLNPLHNPMLQDPDAAGVTGLTRGDKVLQKWWLNHFKKVPFTGKKQLGISSRAREVKLYENGGEGGKKGSSSGDGVVNVSGIGLGTELDENENDRKAGKDLNSGANGKSNTDRNLSYMSNATDKEIGNTVEQISDSDQVGGFKDEFSGVIYADGKRWGYYPGLSPFLSFSDFVDTFFRKGKCNMRVFMVWNSPPWMYSVRQQRGLESLLSHHRDACVLVFSETIELDFFKDNFVKDGYKVAVAMPNLDELLKDTPTHIFASAWFEWRKTKYYATHYSELVRLAALYKYGGIYLDSDIIVLKPLSSLRNSVGKEDQLAASSLNGAVMAFERNSPFIMECLKDFYMTYDDTRLRWNGADLLSRVARRFLGVRNKSVRQLQLKVQPSFIFFPITSQNISRYFTAPTTETEKAEQDALFRKILNESLTFHFWNSLTSSLIPELESLATRLIDHTCIRCTDVL
ncbi:PREDICTED: lactosylceramide [Prunus dulcis]|uniref:PREDICTED: lactosylceramide n=1 Tax=Prunus dulcis TaxID=3755 RepID=A0A5E4FMI5_PRUDU|nr:uncharacterized protein At4g19900-like isoform X1 [Prunus dulcis]XP_034213637.1 uncharacterized protein At4g19900 isoform X1 [Prunus dulcis]KAI5332300.1 hypothetical protein L3X38_022429 [Prunus dulcis]VVA22731.1 PREDICTED: lactosylceramide [Prunus dulcis]VVA27238.1 PREDICTED: lactosylceramide [Prunus dulcis]